RAAGAGTSLGAISFTANRAIEADALILELAAAFSPDSSARQSENRGNHQKTSTSHVRLPGRQQVKKCPKEGDHPVQIQRRESPRMRESKVSSPLKVEEEDRLPPLHQRHPHQRTCSP